MSYTVKNLRQVDDMAPRFGFQEVQEARFPYRDLDAETIGMAFHRVKPGRRQAFAHRHERAEEIYVVLSGTGRMKLDDEIIEIGEMDAIRVAPPAQVSALESENEKSIALTFSSSRSRVVSGSRSAN